MGTEDGIKKPASLEGKQEVDIKNGNSQAECDVKREKKDILERVKDVVPSEADNMEETQDVVENDVEISGKKHENEGGKEVRHPLYNSPGEFSIPDEDKEMLDEQISAVSVKGYEKLPATKKFLAAILTGYSVATEKDYKGSVASFSTRTSLVEINGKKYFIVYNYPGSSKHRNADTKCRKVWGEKALKATEDNWRDVFASRSLIPVYKDENPRIVVLPFIQNIGLVDLLERDDDEKFQGKYSYGREFSGIDKKTEIVTDVVRAMKTLHNENKTWGEIIPANLGLSKDGNIMFFDPETPYSKETPLIEQKARDLLSWCLSSCAALYKSKDKFTDYKKLIHQLLDLYGDSEIIKYLQENLAKDIGFWKSAVHPIAWGQLKARLTVSSRKQYNELMDAIRSYRQN